MIQPQPLVERRRMLARLTTSLASKPGALSPNERQNLRALTRELELIEDDILSESEKAYALAFRNYLVAGRHGLTAAERSLIEAREKRDMQSGQGAYPGSVSGPFAPVTFIEQLFEMVKSVDDLFDPDVVTRIETVRGGPAGMPNMDDTSSAATQVSQAVQDVEKDTNLGQLSFATCPTWRSGIIKTSIEFEQNSLFRLDLLLANSFAVRFARGIGASNVSKLLAAATLGATAAGSASNDGGSETGATSVGSDDLYSLVGSLDPAYVASPKSAWVMNYSTVIAIGKLKDKGGRPLKLIQRNPDTGELELLFKPVRICPSMPNVGTGNTPIAFGDLSRFVVRIVPESLRTMRLDERWAEYGKVGFEGFLRADAGVQVTSGADSPIKYLQNS